MERASAPAVARVNADARAPPKGVLLRATIDSQFANGLCILHEIPAAAPLIARLPLGTASAQDLRASSVEGKMQQEVGIGRRPETARSAALGKLSTVLTVAMHLSVLFVFVVPVSPALVALAALSYAIRMWAITAGYHRYFAHRAFKTSRAFQFVLALLGTASMQNGPLWWASWHRRHHKSSDTAKDPHSPARRGFWYAHMGWFLDGSHDNPDLSNVRDLARHPEIVFLDRHKWFPIVGWALGCFAIAGLPGVVWGFCVSTIVLLHATMFINSLAHVWGTRRYGTTDSSRNNPLLAILTLGEGWHNNHHHAMRSARQGFRWWEIDVTYYSLWVLARLGIVWELWARKQSS
jgi:stearoyl-CoA desaturase (Delta-9 desaturase)